MATIKGYHLDSRQCENVKNADGSYTIQRTQPKERLTKKQRHAIRMAQKEERGKDTFDWLADAKKRGDEVQAQAAMWPDVPRDDTGRAILQPMSTIAAKAAEQAKPRRAKASEPNQPADPSEIKKKRAPRTVKSAVQKEPSNGNEQI